MNRIEELFSLYDKEDINKMSTGVCCICGLNDHWNSKDNNGKWLCYKHCSEEKAEHPKEAPKQKVEEAQTCYLCGVYDKFISKNKDNKYICYKCQLWVDFNQDKGK